MRDPRPDVRAIIDATDRAMQDELEKWTYDLPEEFRLALSRAVVKRLQEASMLNYDRPWEIDDQFGDVLAQAGIDPIAADLSGTDTRPKASSCPECKAMAGTRHLDGCSAQYREDYVGGDA